MKPARFTFLLLLIFSFALPAWSQESDPEDTKETVYEEENEMLDYRAQDMFRLLDTPRFQIGLFGVTTPFSGQQSFGGGLDLRLNYTNNLSLGLSLAITGRRISSDFGYIVAQPLMTYYDISLFNELKILQWKRFEAAIRLYTGFSAYKLADNSIKERYTWYTEDGFPMEGERAVTVDNNYFMRVAPAAVLRYQAGRTWAIEGSAAYNFYLGNARFGSAAGFMNYQLQLGVKLDIGR